MKKTMFLIVVILLTLCFGTTLSVSAAVSESASPDGEVQELLPETVLYVNPFYAELVDQAETSVDEIDLTLYNTPRTNVQYVSSINAAAAQLRKGLVNRESTIDVYYESSSFNSNCIRTIYNAACAYTGNPKEGDYIKNNLKTFSGRCVYRTVFVNGRVVYRYIITYTVQYYTNAKQEAEFDAKLKSVLASAPFTSAKTEEEKVTAIYNYITSTVTYDHEHIGDTVYLLQQTAYGALIKGTSVCQGYATLFYRMGLELGLNCREVTGYGITGSSSGLHAWNIVKIGKSFYNLDATWDAGLNINNYLFFLKGSKDDFNSYHVRDSEFQTVTFNTAYPMSPTNYKYTVDRGTLGSNLTWVLDCEHGLSLSGTGAMADYSSSSSMPWYKYSPKITSVTLGSGVTSIPKGAFVSCSSLKSIIVENKDAVIGDNAFALNSHPTIYGYANSTAEAYAKAKKITFSAVDAHYHSWVLKKTVPATLDKSGSKTYTCTCGKTNIESTNKLAAKKGLQFTNGGFTYEITSTSSKTLKVVATGKTGKVTITNTVRAGGKTYKVTAVAPSAFKGNTKITAVTVGSNVTAIGKNSFYKCTKLKTVTVGANVKTIGAQAFYGCKALTSLTFKGKQISSVGSKSFKGTGKNKVTVKASSSKLSIYKKKLKKAGLTAKAYKKA